jgi:uncharacterized protein YdeI (YjbR/CyaY-like superfamily)
MATHRTNAKVDLYISKAKKWQEETEQLRDILLDCGLTEDLKWGKPCYSFEESNVAIIQGFKEYFALLFFKGVLLKDPKKVLVKTGENTHVGRQLRFASVKEIVKMKPILKAYVKEAIDIEKAGLKVETKSNRKLVIAEEFKQQLSKKPALETAFNALTPGRQRAYIFYFSQAKQAQTRIARIERCIPQILRGKGLND